MTEQEKFEKAKEVLDNPPEGMGVKQHIELLINGLPYLKEAAKNEKEFDQMVENEIEQDKIGEEPITCYECGEEVGEDEVDYARVVESPKDELGVRVPFCPACYEKLCTD